MNIGLDWYGTVASNIPAYKSLIDNIQPNEIHIITAVKAENVNKVKLAIKRSGIKANVHVVVFTNYMEVPFQKLEKAKELNIHFYIDDRKDTCNIFNRNGILAVQSLGEDNEYKLSSKRSSRRLEPVKQTPGGNRRVGRGVGIPVGGFGSSD